MLNKSQIEDNIYFAFRKSQIKSMETERLGIIHVSDLLKECPRLVVYNKLEPTSGGTTEDIRSLYFGQLVHSNSYMTNCSLHEVFLAYDFINDKSLTYAEAVQIPKDDPRQLDIIYGSVDDIMQIGDEYVICDKKTTGHIDYFKKDSSSANDNHKFQINMYKVLLEKCMGIESKWGCVMYISNNTQDERDTPTPKSFRLTDTDKTFEIMKERAENIRTHIRDKLLPNRVKNFMCDGMCPHAIKCFTDERVTLK